MLLLLAVALVELVNPFVGTSGYGHTTPAASCPFGMVQPGPDTGNCAWKYCGGYQYDDRTLIFGHTPTLTYPEMQGRAEVLFAETYINIDCGAVFHEAGGKLACLRLDDMKVFYV